MAGRRISTPRPKLARSLPKVQDAGTKMRRQLRQQLTKATKPR